MNRIPIVLAVVLVLVCPLSPADEPITEEESSGSTVEMQFPPGPDFGGPDVEDYRRCNSDCKTVWSEGMKDERLRCIAGCRHIRSCWSIDAPQPAR